MRLLDPYYVQLLHVGFVVLQQAIDAQDPSWLSAEIEFLHNIPSLIGDDNNERHRYFWVQERSHFIRWVDLKGSPFAKSRFNTYYAPILEEMSSVMANIRLVSK